MYEWYNEKIGYLYLCHRFCSTRTGSTTGICRTLRAVAAAVHPRHPARKAEESQRRNYMLSNNYVLILLWTGVLAVLYHVVPGVRRVELVNGRQAERVTPWFAVMAVLPLVYFASVRGGIADSLLSSKLQKN